jgi:CHAD domain-containing protein
MSEAAAETLAVPPLIYQIELGFPPGVAPRWAALGQVSGARRHPRPTQLIWHDTSTADLARHQLALAEQDGIWRLSALRPGKHVWPPASPPPLLAEAANFDDLGLAIASPVAPVASFNGQIRQVEIVGSAGMVAARWLTGQIRCVVDEAPDARIELTGPREALLAAALALAEQGAFVPLSSLPQAALTLAEHGALPPRHLGAAQIPVESINLADGLAFAIGQLVDTTLYWAARIPPARNGEPVHQMRVAVRRLRSLLGTPRKTAVGEVWLVTKQKLGSLARELGDARAWDVFLEGAGAEMTRAWPDDRRITSFVARARKQRETAYAVLRADLAGDRMRKMAVELALFAKLRPFVVHSEEIWTTDCREFAGAALDRRLHKLSAPGEDLDGLSATELHEIRKNAKRLRYGCELFAGFWGGKPVRKYLERLSELQESLGEINDAASLEPLLASLGPCGFAAGMAVGIATERARPALKQAQTAWRKLLGTDEFWS